MAAAARQHAADRPRSRAGSSRTRRSRRRSPAPQPYGEWLGETQFKLEDLPPADSAPRPDRDGDQLRDRQQAFGYTRGGSEVLPGADGAARRRSDRLDGHRHADRRALAAGRKLLYDYFKQNFAQVTNPPIDPIREALVMSPGVDDRAAAEPARPPGRHPQEARSLAADPHRRGSGEDPRDRARRSTAPSAPRTLDATWPAAATARRSRRRCSGCAGKRPRRCSPTPTS